MPADIGNQTISIIYHNRADSGAVNLRHKDVRRFGIYSGGYLSIVDGSHCQISALICEITDGVYQVKVQTASTVNLAVSSATPYVVLRWTYVGAVDDYMELLAVSNPQSNDLIVGKCSFNGGGVLQGFIYSERSNPNVFDLFFKVESTGQTELRVRARSGRIHTESGVINIPDQKSGLFVPPPSNSKIFLVYINELDGTVNIDSSGTAAATPSAPNYDNRMVLAEVTLSAGNTNIPDSAIKDVRNFITPPVVPDDIMIERDDDGKLTTKRCFRDYILIRDVKDSGVDGGTFTSGDWRIRDLTEETSDVGNHAGLGANQITLGAGTYEFHVKCPASDGTSEIGLHQARLYNVTDASVVAYGSSERCDVSGYVTTSSIIVGRFIITDSKTFRVEHRCEKTVATLGFGKACNFGGSEVYTIAEFWKVK